MSAATLLSACTTTAPVDSVFPEPVIDSMPLAVGIQFGEELSNYEYREEIRGERRWIVQMGAANVAMFESVLGSMFSTTKIIPADGEMQVSLNDLDAIIRPELETFEFSMPDPRWHTDSFTVWITYRMNMFRPDGSLIASWPVRAYGHSRHQWFNADDSLAEAATMALRDAGAYLTLYFKDEPKIKEWLREEAAKQARERRRGSRPGRARR